MKIVNPISSGYSPKLSHRNPANGIMRRGAGSRETGGERSSFLKNWENFFRGSLSSLL
ncbi:MAG: hypothetical protein NTZ51_06605 [Proteobacteria bacterium]|nr:hypothetical protein [Pseudomonadota bacterium]